MNCIRRLKVVALVCFVVFTSYYVFSGPYYESTLKSLRKIQTEHFEAFKNDLGKTFKYKWKSIGSDEKNHKVYSAYFDYRIHVLHRWSNNLIGSVRVFAILDFSLSSEPMECSFKYKNGDVISVVADESQAIEEHWDMDYASFTISCPIYKDGHGLPIEVSLQYRDNSMTYLSPTFIPISYPKSLTPKLKPEIALCIGPLQYNYAQGLRIVEYFEIYKLLGVTKFYVYYLSSSDEVRKIIDYYEKEGLIEIFDWELNGYHFENNFRYGGIFSSLNECVYRSRVVDSFKYAAIIDFDEVLMPFKNNTLTDFIESVGDHSEYIFSNTFFHKYMKVDDSSTPNDAVNKFLYTQSRIERTQVYIKTSRTKYIVDTEEAIEIGNHHTWRTVSSNTFYVPEDLGLLFHYRDGLVRNEDIEEVNVDFSARRFGSKLWKGVDLVCAEIFEDGKCPL
ncbi:hypothetical protein ACFFRR_003587 [Megaselia abdita]